MHPRAEGFVDLLVLFDKGQTGKFLGFDNQLPMVTATSHIAQFDFRIWKVFQQTRFNICLVHFTVSSVDIASYAKPAKLPTMHKRVLYLATQNQHKVEELRAILGADKWDVRSLSELAPDMHWDEIGTTFTQNARIKALKVREYTGAAVLADDSGLCVRALDGAPGVISAHYAGRHGDSVANNQKLLREMIDVPMTRRGAEFVCLLYFVDEQGQEWQFEGRCGGMILPQARGGAGFGYDPLFYVPAYGKSMAELSAEEKNRISHRGVALHAFQSRIHYSGVL